MRPCTHLEERSLCHWLAPRTCLHAHSHLITGLPMHDWLCNCARFEPGAQIASACMAHGRGCSFACDLGLQWAPSGMPVMASYVPHCRQEQLVMMRIALDPSLLYIM